MGAAKKQLLDNDATGIIDESVYEKPADLLAKRKERLEKSLEGRSVLRKEQALPIEEWKAKYPQHLVDNAEDMSGEKLASSSDDLKKIIRTNKLKSLAKGLGKGLAEGMAWGVALDPSDIAPSEMPEGEALEELEAEMRMKNVPYNYPTKFEALRKKLGK